MTLAAGLLLAVYALGWIIAGWTGAPAVQNLATPARPLAAAEVALAADLTGRDAAGRPVLRQAGFDRLLKLIAEADDLLVLDQFLVNTFMAGPDNRVPAGRDLAGELVAALVRQKTAVPGLRVLFITDPINGCYRAGCPPALAALPKAGIPVLVTDLDATPGRNWLTGPFQRALEPLLDTLPPARAAVLPNPFGRNAGQLSAADWLRLLSFRANHRKVAAGRTRDGRCQALVASGNPHNASAANGNLAVWLSGPAAGDILRSEVELARGILLRAPDNCHGPVPAWELWRDLDHWPLPPAPLPAARADDRPVAPSQAPPGTGDRPVAPMVSFLTDARIGEAAGRLLAAAGPGDRVDALLFQLADPPLIRAFQDAARRGACVRLLLDSNRSSFGRDKRGIPNQVTAAAMHDWAARHDAPLTIRWFATAGEQGHFKALRVAGSRAAAPDALLTGSANFTGRNLHGYTLEADLLLSPAGTAGRQFDGIFATLWENQDGLVYSEGYPARALAPGPSRWARQLAAALAEITGFCTY